MLCTLHPDDREQTVNILKFYLVHINTLLTFYVPTKQGSQAGPRRLASINPKKQSLPQDDSLDPKRRCFDKKQRQRKI